MLPRPALPIVTSLYKSEPYIEEFHRRVTQTVGALKKSNYEVVYVDGRFAGSCERFGAQAARP
jgi:hypothetical protein